MAQPYGLVLNPIAHLDKIGTPEKKLSRQQQAVHRRVAQFEAQRAKEDSMAGSSVVQDLNPGIQHQTKATFTAKKSSALPAPPQPKFQAPPPAVRQTATVQRVSNPLAEPVQDVTGFDELEAEFGEGPVGQEAAAPLSHEPEPDVDDILKRFKGSPDEIAKQIAKSYAASEKRMRQLEAEKQLFVKQGAQTPPVQPVAQTPTNQLQVTPQFNYKRFKDNILDDGDKVAQEFEQHLTTSLDQKMAGVIAPLYEEALDNRLFRKYGDVVTEDNLDLIKAMAQTQPGQNRWDKMVSAVTQYKTSIPTPTPHELPEVQAMQKAAQSPSPQARTSGEKKMFKQTYLRELMDTKIKTGEYQRDPKWRRMIDAAYREGRVLRGQ